MPQELLARLDQHRSALLAKIAAAAATGDAGTVLVLNDALRRTAAVVEKLREDAQQARLVLEEAVSTHIRPRFDDKRRRDHQTASGRALGSAIRSAFLERAGKSGVQLTPYRGALFTAGEGTRVGIAVATERKPNRWFLGLGDGMFDAAALLCVRTSGRVLDVCLPASFFAEFGRFLSRSGGQVKFNLALRDGHLMIKVPTQRPVRVDAFVGAIAGLVEQR